LERGSSIWNIFFEECDEQLTALMGALERLHAGDQTPDCINIAFRAVHSIKGGGGIFGLNAVVSFADVFETTIGLWRGGKLSSDPAMITVLIGAAVALTALVTAARDDAPVPIECDIAALYATLESGALLQTYAASSPADATASVGAAANAAANAAAPLGGTVAAGSAALILWRINFTPTGASARIAHEISLLLHELEVFGPIEVLAGQVSVDPLAEILPEQCAASWSVTLRSNCNDGALRAVFAFADDDWDIQVTSEADTAPDTSHEDLPPPEPLLVQPADLSRETPPQPAPAPLPEPSPETPDQIHEPSAEPAQRAQAAAKTLRVDLDRIDRMIDLVGELVINGSILGQKLLESGVSRTGGVALAMRDLEHLTREIQDGVMTIRAQPVRAVFQRMTRLVREVAALTGKPARLITEGDNIELDQTVIERIGEPLTHLIRDAVDHGLEDAATRLAASKPPEGVIHLRALHRAGRIVLEVADDGGGLDRARIKSIAVQRGLIAPDSVLPDAEIDELIFLPGFSTASSAANNTSGISGGGEGMDVVRRSVQALGGRISVASQPGAGVRFSMSLPLTLAVVDGMVVEAAGQTLIVPLAVIIEALKPRAANVHDVEGALQLLALGGAFVPLVDVALKLNFSAARAVAVDSVALLVETELGVRAALLMDRIIEQRQVVVKSLKANFRPVPCIAAATVLGDGRVALILDVDTVIPAPRAAPAGLKHHHLC
jgi:two-component system chemotaxis sensor kinase CheA